ncbi:g7965 [Coccomyxa elongata]
MHVQQDVLKAESIGEYRLSLNKRDELLGDPGSFLKDLGLCSGDLLWVMSDSTKAVPTPPQASLPAGLSTSDASPGVGVSVMDTAAEAQVPRMVFSTSSSVEALRLLVHAALLDSGLEPLETARNGGAAAASDVSELQYVLRASPGHETAAHRAACSIKYVNFSTNLVVWGTTASKGTCHISIAAADYIYSQLDSRDQSLPESVSQPTLYAKDISNLHMRLKDCLIHPILIALCAEEGRSPPPSFLLLPTEIKLLCLRHLQARDLAALACVSRDMRCVACSDTVWEPLFVAEFGAPSPADGLRPGTGAFMPAFGARWAERERRRRQRRRMLQDPRLPYPGSGPHLVVPHPYYPSGIVGGDYDRLPQPFLGFSGSRGSGSGGSGLFRGPGFGFSASRRPRWSGLS